METITTAQKIERLEKEIAELRKQERLEKETERKKARAEREAELQKIKDALNEFNKKYNDTLCLGVKRNSDAGRDLIESMFPWWG